MAYKKIGLVSFLIVASASSAFANSSPAYNPGVTTITSQINQNSSSSIRHLQVIGTPFMSSKTSFPKSARKIRIVREPLPGQSRVIQSTSDKSVIAVPNHSSGSMKIIKPSARKMNKSAIPNLYSE